ncbi:methylenetetrahydrofolate reductase [Schizosaccharomyces japonicus yFS275]|uniref:Methylenetetrahydrofolate dehydrogenase [NAD(+)] n=1 Tax=Schizosaccharomyces japonicus (strain yFS275 / FY16936) TaxID=402676 RepID=B6JZT6_SCHJY|nr:methylenetetrahydrofolate reductase [Schizosaccharomyces japonicus yFS275]EEB06086.1 methylenetetrahydrofolate reductase [Schizosaccharomyces japonicus yFS275]
MASSEAQPSHYCKVVFASKVAEPFITELKKVSSTFEKPLKLVGFLANKDPAARMYAEWTGKTVTEVGFDFELREVDKDDLEDAIVDANLDRGVNGIMVYFPVFGNRQDQYLQQVVSPSKDVEGLCHQYVMNMYHNIRFLDDEQTMKSILPCTPLAIVKILEFLGVYNKIINYGNRLYGKTITVVNRSEIVGRPLAALLANDGAKVYSVDIKGIQLFTRGAGIRKRKHEVTDVDLKLEDVAPQSDVIICGVPSANYKFPSELIRDGATCICFSSDKNFDSVTVKQHAGIYVPSIGKVTIAMLLRNLVRLASYQNGTPSPL